MSEPRTRTALGVAERDATWRSSFNGSEWRWDDKLGSWVLRFAEAPDWHTPRPNTATRTAYSQAGERFVEVL